MPNTRIPPPSTQGWSGFHKKTLTERQALLKSNFPDVNAPDPTQRDLPDRKSVV